ncbi:UNKNOWN [Stylonychia lemnae]|uniref:Uncharacterized protein n=1 Tax=Stylonychia lemnae TaxID=5949 RepID=A0A078AK06_STYLE|nr:UNKNOWN [Stylonychia lemnae]|eukprot:CDW81138.1 UNKNOWN [Stylonychia lemnae]
MFYKNKTLLSRQNSFEDLLHQNLTLQDDNVDMAELFLKNLNSTPQKVSSEQSVDSILENKQSYEFEALPSNRFLYSQREIDSTVSDTITMNSGLSNNEMVNPEVLVTTFEYTSLQSSLDSATSDDLILSTEKKRYVRDKENEVFLKNQMKAIRLECNYKQFFRWMRNLVQKNTKFRNGLQNDEILSNYFERIVDLFPKKQKTIYKNSQESKKNVKYEPRNISTRRGEKPNKTKSIEKLNQERLQQLSMIDILCNRITREAIVSYFSYDILAYLFEFMLQYIDINQRFYTKETALARMVLEEIKYERCGSQQDIINREYLRSQSY